MSKRKKGKASGMNYQKGQKDQKDYAHLNFLDVLNTNLLKGGFRK